MKKNGDKGIVFYPLIADSKVPDFERIVQYINLNLRAENPAIFAPKAIAISKSPVCTTSSLDTTILMSADSSMLTLLPQPGRA